MKLQAAQEGLEGDRRHRARPDRQARAPAPARSSRPHLNFSIRPGRPRRAADRPEADPRRLEAARGDRHLPRRRPQPVRRPSRPAAARPGPADVQGGARSAGCWPTPTSTSTRAAATTSAPARSTAACSATLEFLAASGLHPTVTSLKLRPQLPDRRRQRLRPLLGQRGRHRRRSTAPRSSATRARARSPRPRSAS